MLTGNLIRVKTGRGTITPRLVEPESVDLLERSQALIEALALAREQGWTRSKVQDAVRELEGFDTDHKLTRGLAKVLVDKAEFETVSPLPPAEIRALVFREAARRGPMARRSGPTGRLTARDVLEDLGREVDADADELGRALYADLKDQQVVTGCWLPEPERLLQRYNVALVQAVLLKASHMKIELECADPKRMRQLVRYLKFHQLMYRVELEPGVVRLHLDGPESLLRLSTRYGMQLANFFPALLLQSGAWRMEALVHWGRRRLRKTLQITSDHGLSSHYRDQGAWRSRAETWFEERFVALETGWCLEPGEPLDLGSQDLLVPDFTFRKQGRVAHLDIVGFWRKGYLDKRLKSVPDNVVVAVSRKLSGDKKSTLPDRVVAFSEVIPPKKVLALVEQVARKTP